MNFILTKISGICKLEFKLNILNIFNVSIVNFHDRTLSIFYIITMIIHPSEWTRACKINKIYRSCNTLHFSRVYSERDRKKKIANLKNIINK